MTTKKIDVFQNFENTEMKRLQVVYLNYHSFSTDQIAKWTGYAKSTIKSYVKKFSDLLDKAKQTFYHVSIKTKQVLCKGRQYVYLFKFYNENGEIIWSKVGTTTRLPNSRLKEELKYYRSKGATIGNAEICSVIDCGAVPAEGAESVTRAAFIKKYPTSFQKNDRFTGVDISTRTFNSIVMNYLNENTEF